MSESRHTASGGKLRLGGAAVPAVLVGVSVLLVLLVVLIQSIMNGGGDVVALAGSSPPAVDRGQVADGRQTQSAADQPDSPQPAKPATPKPSGSGSPAPRSTPAPPAFNPISIEAESATLGGTAAKATCPAGNSCSGGVKVRFIGGSGNGSVTFSGLTVPATATYHLTIGYELGDTTHGPFYINVNGGPTMQVSGTPGSWSAMSTMTVAIVLAAGPNTVRFGGSASVAAPDLDKITLGP
jgi:hypothetical protein